MHPSKERIIKVRDQEFTLTTQYNHLLRGKKFYQLFTKDRHYLGSPLHLRHAKAIARFYMEGNEPLDFVSTILFLKEQYKGIADFDEAMSGTVYMCIYGKKIRISDHEGNGLRGIPDIELSSGYGRKDLIRRIDSLIKLSRTV